MHRNPLINCLKEYCDRTVRADLNKLVHQENPGSATLGRHRAGTQKGKDPHYDVAVSCHEVSLLDSRASIPDQKKLKGQEVNSIARDELQPRIKALENRRNHVLQVGTYQKFSWMNSMPAPFSWRNSTGHKKPKGSSMIRSAKPSNKRALPVWG